MEKTLANRDIIIKNVERFIPNVYEYLTKNEIKRIVWGNLETIISRALSPMGRACEVWRIISELREDLRRCDFCGRLMKKGYYLSGVYACSDVCRNNLYMEGDNNLTSMEDAESAYLRDNKEDSSEFFYTEWE